MMGKIQHTPSDLKIPHLYFIHTSDFLFVFFFFARYHTRIKVNGQPLIPAALLWFMGSDLGGGPQSGHMINPLALKSELECGVSCPEVRLFMPVATKVFN